MTRHLSRLHELDLLRGLACLMVVGFHYLYRGPVAGWSPVVPWAGFAEIARYGYFGVHLFFIISGFVILMSARHASAREFVASRVARLYPAYWPAVLLTWGLMNATHFVEAPLSVRDLLVNLTMFPQWFHIEFVDGVYWTLAVELQFYLLVWLVLKFGMMGKVQALLGWWLLIAALNLLRPISYLEIWLAARWAPFFCFGALVFLQRVDGFSWQRAALMLLAYGLAIDGVWGAVVQARHPELVADSPLLACLLVTGFFAAFWWIGTGRGRLPAWSWVTWAGALTYPVYLVHQNVGYVLLGQLTSSGWSVESALLVVLSAVFVTAWLLHMCAERPLAPRLKAWIRA